ncbi:hypothetical protein [Streptomyces avermitilis]|uniref:hypothetical protein n=1 Tax=Streptomyces avermitilis TaxID=33903 RepID=UPI0036A7E992
MNPPTQRPALSARDTEAPTPQPGADAEHAADAHPVRATMILLPLQLEEEPRWTWSTTLRADWGAGSNARLRVRPRLTMSHWTGNIDVAARVADKLVDNAARHGKPFGAGHVVLRLTLLPTDELLIEVDDSHPSFPDFEAVASGSLHQDCGLWWVNHYRAKLSWAVKRDANDVVIGKTVQALLPVAWGEPT